MKIKETQQCIKFLLGVDKKYLIFYQLININIFRINQRFYFQRKKFVYLIFISIIIHLFYCIQNQKLSNFLFIYLHLIQIIIFIVQCRPPNGFLGNKHVINQDIKQITIRKECLYQFNLLSIINLLSELESVVQVTYRIFLSVILQEEAALYLENVEFFNLANTYYSNLLGANSFSRNLMDRDYKNCEYPHNQFLAYSFHVA
ncbi:transmembrane protein, putative (macronuclear) [Tetrahymena thermophila SB210]|uniref:Transmembrane protein, putative n=1 Tax=Tetrahymena thermophila (strain SB210) TaxID=312017 RepID=W7XE34_TETTS|nr:transmembrane protein, putative [Tetrahymena thermophila SB210]EWS74793.1 transmembrane protein, putative [Tetrahymena thermophila SB210]|eukprot:XP_012652686.1 transmembrane protein, putative [Tetrahymena thermophila SB210]